MCFGFSNLLTTLNCSNRLVRSKFQVDARIPHAAVRDVTGQSHVMSPCLLTIQLPSIVELYGEILTENATY